MRITLGQVAETETLQHLADSAARIGLRRVSQPQTIGHILENAAMRPDGIGLKHQAEAALLRRNFQSRSRVKNNFAAQFDLSRIRALQAGYRSKQRRLAASGRPEESEDFSLLQLKRYPAQHRGRAELLLDFLRHQIKHRA